MNKQQHKQLKHQLRKGRVRSRVSGTDKRPRLSIFRSNSQIYAQLIDDVSGKTIAASSTVNLKVTGNKTAQAEAVGKSVAEQAVAKGVKAVVFDRGGYKYHGRVKALADAARTAGLQF